MGVEIRVDVYSSSHMIRILGTIFAGLMGLAFGSFLNVCLSRWPAGESVVKPRSHCRNCDHSLAWWENVPLVSWVMLRGRCRKCGTAIGWRYPLVELAVGVLWALSFWNLSENLLQPGFVSIFQYNILIFILFQAVLYWILVALSVLDAEHLWLPDAITFPGIALGLVATLYRFVLPWNFHSSQNPPSINWQEVQRHLLFSYAIHRLLAMLAAAALILLIRWIYKLVRKREGMGLGDAKLMAMLAAWLGLPGALLAFGLGAILGSVVALVLLLVPAARRGSETWAGSKLPFGTFLCAGGIVSSLWGQSMIAAYLRWAGF